MSDQQVHSASCGTTRGEPCDCPVGDPRRVEEPERCTGCGGVLVHGNHTQCDIFLEQNAELPPNAVLSFPEMGITWPVPFLVMEGIKQAVAQAGNNGAIDALQKAINRVQAIHAPEERRGKVSCSECGRNSGYPCETIMAVIGSNPIEDQEGEALMTDQPIEQPEVAQDPANPTTDGTPEADTAVPDAGADLVHNDPGVVESKEGGTVTEMKGTDSGL